MMRYLAFDLVVAKAMPRFETNFKKHRPLGIACAVTQASDDQDPKFWYSKDASGTPLPRMAFADLKQLVSFLAESTRNGTPVLTWNGLQFLFSILAEESGQPAECKALARNHVDILFQIHCELGYPLTFDAVADGMGCLGDEERLESWKLPQMWIDGKHEEVLKHIAENVRIEHVIARGVEENFKIYWAAKSGKSNSKSIQRWLTTDQARELPMPDTKWMGNPVPRSHYYEWLNAG